MSLASSATSWLCVTGFLLVSGVAAPSGAQTISQRGFLETRAMLFPQAAPNDPTRAVVDALVREELFAKPAAWIQFAAGVDLRAASHARVEDSWSLDWNDVWSDRSIARPRLSIRRLSATLNRRWLTLDVGKQFIRWGKTDIVTPTDRFAPRDFLDVFDNEFLPVTGARVTVRAGNDSIEGVWIPRLTPSRIPLLDQRWTAVGENVAGATIVDVSPPLPRGAELGVRWSHVGDAFETSLSIFDGFNHLPNVGAAIVPTATVTGAFAPPITIAVSREYPAIRSYGVDAALPLRWATVKGEAAYVTSPPDTSDEYVLYVVQLERQTGEWVLVGGYAGEVVVTARTPFSFAPDRGVARAFVGRASYTIDPNRSVAFETAIRQTLSGAYGRAEFSQAYGQHWRTTITATLVRGAADDFIGQYRRNSNVAVSLRYSY